MAVDRTNLFLATIKTVKTRNKILNIGSEEAKSTASIHPRPKGEFVVRAKDVIQNISKLRDFLLKHRKDYIDATGFLTSEVSKMTDNERDQIDNDAQTFMRTCSEAIRIFKTEVLKQPMPQQVRSHREAVFELMEAYLKAVCKLYSEQRAIRVKRVVDRKRISRLEPEGRRTGTDMTELRQRHKRARAELNSEEGDHKSETDDSKVMKNTPASDDPLQMEYWDEDEDDELSPEEIQMFEQENERLYNEMNSLVDEVRQIEGKVVEISRLQEIFADKVLQQEVEIDRIADTVVQSTENIKEGNEEVREAMKKDAGFRVWILFFLVMCSFSLLFLEWYS
ncbi:PREDICTED: syntaxin-18-like isoform X2 [Branchiostoma belcheri]|uniref:Syntaxin-18 n=1 Tax=Branchiostoma belcheri TaxID=7741 RepID=A0A6P4XX71_BRABE|nr:PREDICTED: syntaxin-18-like isoform X1 [Branchiostoma belcheri]XP_019615134.1 PREDICTED: syntaxin-18-like isoform X2 [Branchiostoma belcheri]